MFKKVIFIVIVISLFSCKKDSSNTYVKFSGKITNHLGNNGSIKGNGYFKELKINKDGTFSDTLHLSDKGAMFQFTDGNEFTSLYLKNGNNINMTLDTKEFDETIKYTGAGSENNNYLAQKSLLSEKTITGSLFDLDEKSFKVNTSKIIIKFENFLSNFKELDTDLFTSEKEGILELGKNINQEYKMIKEKEAMYAKFIGKPSPTFDYYENIDGTKTSLKDLRGKYVYVDVWATWCGPCKAEIPSLKALETAYHGKDIEFVSISVDNGRGYKDNSLEASKIGWKKMIAEKEMKGIQLFADKAWESDFVKGYGIRGIPRFILIDKSGNVINANAPRPSSEKIKTILKDLKL